MALHIQIANMKNNFKILAIKPLRNCDSRFTKLLTPGDLYCLYNNYTFLPSKENITSINKAEEFPEDYFYVTHDTHQVSINISAIVGKNGSGKSTLFELIYYAVFLIANKAGIIEPSLDDLEKRILDGSITAQQKANYEQSKAELNFIHTHLKAAIYYELNESFYCLLIDKDVRIDFLNGTREQVREEKINKVLGVTKHFFEDFFYSVAINYSLHGLNSKQIGFWIENLFHKNDGYQTPLVINPMRTEGYIDVNSEFHLAQSRMLSNLTTLETDTPEIVNEKTLSGIEFSLHPDELDSLNHIAVRNIFQGFEQQHNIEIFDFFVKISQEVIAYDIPEETKVMLKKKWEEDHKKDPINKFHYNEKPTAVSYDDVYYLFAKYVIRKIFKIVNQYKDYRDQFHEVYTLKYSNGADVKIDSIKSIDELIHQLKEDTSHITYKVKQALYSLKENYFDIKWTVELDPITKYNYCFKSQINYPTLKKKINAAFSKNRNTAKEKINLVPCALVKPGFEVKLPGMVDKTTSLHTMSSGELQFAFTLHSIFYHLQNLSSVLSTVENKKIKYRNINLMLDETELYFHPEFQQDFIHELLKGIGKYRLDEIDAINMMFLTHSPFILSDIPATNILKLNKGISQPYDADDATLGANVHSLLANEFYLSKGFMGKRARLVINDLFTFLQGNEPKNYNFTQASAKLFIRNIGEPLLRQELSKLFDRKFPGSFELEIIDAEMERLRKLKEKKTK